MHTCRLKQAQNSHLERIRQNNIYNPKNGWVLKVLISKYSAYTYTIEYRPYRNRHEKRMEYDNKVCGAKLRTDFSPVSNLLMKNPDSLYVRIK